ncbi:MAG: hypothetical protein U0176_08690 [Bacteroidia bacterium]
MGAAKKPYIRPVTPRNRPWPLVLLFGLILLGIGYFYHDVLLHPNGTFMGSGHDGLKNYYTPWYHAKYDSTFTWFEGMNYPYGDHIVFADGQPLLSNSIKVLGLADWTVGIINCALLLTLLLTGWLIYRILRRWQVGPWWAALAAVAVAMLSPQLVRINNHYGLGYTFVVPLIWHLVLRFFEKPSILRSLPITVTVFLLGWLHPYFVMISAVFMTAFWGFYALLGWRKMPHLQKLLHYGLQVLLPMALFAISLKLTDRVTDRPEHPYGIDEYVASYKTIFAPLALKTLDQIPRKIFKELPPDWEGVAYVGLLGGLTFAIFWMTTLGRLGYGAVTRRLKGFRLVENPDASDDQNRMIVVSMLAGLAVGVFACGFPFAIKPELLTEWFPPIRQFRSLGRFAWVFYYTCLTFGFYLVWRLMAWLKGKKLQVVGIAIGTISLVWTLVEGFALNYPIHKHIQRSMAELQMPGKPGLIPGSQPSEWMKYVDPNAFNAITVLPYFHAGSENLIANEPTYCAQAFEASIRTGIPMMNVMMSRTSLNQTWKQLQWVTGTDEEPEIMKDLGQARILAMRFGKSNKHDGPLVQPILPPMGKPVYQQGEVIFWEMHPQTALLIASRRELVPDSLVEAPSGFKTTRQDSNLTWVDWEKDGNDAGYHGGKGNTVILKDNNLIYDGSFHGKPKDTIVISLWAKIREDQLPTTQLGIEETSATETHAWAYVSLLWDLVCFNGDWALMEREFVMTDPKNTFRLNVTRWKRLPPKVTIDNLLIRSKGVDVYRFENGKPVWKNNRYRHLMVTPPATDSAATSTTH